MDTQLPNFDGKTVQIGTARLSAETRARVGALHPGEKVFFIGYAYVGEISHGEVRAAKTNLYGRKHTLGNGDLVVIGPDLGEKWLQEAQDNADERFGTRNLWNQDGSASSTEENDDDEDEDNA